MRARSKGGGLGLVAGLGPRPDGALLAGASLGMGLFWAWTLLTCYDLMIFPSSGSASSYAHGVWIWNSWAQALAFVAIAAFARPVRTLLQRRRGVAVAAVAASLSTALLPIGSSFLADGGQLAFLVGMGGAVATGCAGACTILMWSELLSCLGARLSTAVMNVSLVLSAGLYVAISCLPPEAATAVVVLLPCAAGALLSRGRRAAAPPPDGPRAAGAREGSPRVLIPLATSFFCALCGEVFRNLITVTQSDGGFVLMGSIYAVGGGVGVLALSCVLLASRAHRKVNGDSLAIRLVLAAMVLGYLVTVVFNASIYVGYAFFCAVFGGIRALSWMFAARIVERGGASPLAAFAISLSSFSLPVALSTAFMDTLTADISSGSLPWTSVAVAIIAALFLIAILILDARDIRSNWGMTPAGDGEDLPRAAPGAPGAGGGGEPEGEGRVLSLLREERGLTNRELDVARLLCQGRSIPFIQEELCIAEGTALTHVRHIYRKLDVHTRQEFITAVQSLQAAARGR